MIPTNRVILTGRVTRPPQRSFRPDGSCVLQFPLELNDQEPRSARSGRNRIDIVVFGKLAEIESNRLQNGQQLRVEGHLKQRHWQTPEGKNRTLTEVIATDLQTVDTSNSTERGEKNEKTC